MAGTQAVHIPYKGISGAVMDLISGNIQVLITTPASVGEQIKSGLVKAIAVGSSDRSKYYPDLPTIAQTVPGYRAEGWWGVFAPGGTPKPVVDALAAVWTQVKNQSPVKDRLDSLGMRGPDRLMAGDALQAFLRHEDQRTAKLIKDLGIKPQ